MRGHSEAPGHEGDHSSAEELSALPAAGLAEAYRLIAELTGQAERLTALNERLLRRVRAPHRWPARLVRANLLRDLKGLHGFEPQKQEWASRMAIRGGPAAVPQRLALRGRHDGEVI